MKRTLVGVTINALLLVGAALTLLPLLWMVSASLMPAGEANALPPRIFPSHPTLEHYAVCCRD
jgi:multiple sugar transport system permease protein